MIMARVIIIKKLLCIWPQSCVGTNVSAWAQKSLRKKSLGTNVSGHRYVGIEARRPFFVRAQPCGFPTKRILFRMYK